MLFCTWWKLWPQPSSVLELARRGQMPRWIQMFPSCNYEPPTLLPGAGTLQMVDVSDGMWVPHRAAVFEMWTDNTPIP